MAVAGKVAITLDNEESWREDKQYDKLVAVQYQGDMYISRKASVGVEPANNEYWFLAVTGSEVDIMTSETMGIGRPDNDTITVADGVFKAEINKELLDKLGESDEGTLTFGGSEIKTSTDYVAETVDDAQAAVDSGNVDDGATIYVKEDSDSAVIVDSELSETSKNPVQNKVIDAAIKNLSQAIEQANQLITNLQALRASSTTYGMTKVTDSSAVTDSTGLALAATEKNATIQGTLANQISQLNTDCLKKHPYLGENYVMNCADFAEVGWYGIASLSESDEKNYPHPYNPGYYQVLCIGDNNLWKVLMMFSPRLWIDNKMYFYIGLFSEASFVGWFLFSCT